MAYLSALTNSAGILSAPADLSFFDASTIGVIGVGRGAGGRGGRGQ